MSERMSGRLDPVELQVLAGALRADLRGDGRGADPFRPLGEHQGAARRFDRSVRPARRDGDAGRAHPCPPRRDAGRRRRVLNEEHAPGRGWILNDPYAGRHPPAGHHRDHAACSPAIELIAFAASRAHHADVGGPTPGSMPADSRKLDDEGVVIEPQVLDEDAIAELSAQMRQPDQRRADLRAQLAASRVGARRLLGWPRASAPRAGAGVRGGARLRGAAHPRVYRGARRRRPHPPATCSRRARATSRSRCARRSRATASCSTSPAPPPSTTAT